MSARRPIVSLSFHTPWGLRLTIAPIEGGKWQAWGPLAAGMIDKDGERLMRAVVEFATLEYLDHDATPKELADAIEEADYPWDELRRLVRLFRGEEGRMRIAFYRVVMDDVDGSPGPWDLGVPLAFCHDVRQEGETCMYLVSVRGEDAERFEAAAKASPHVRSIRSDGDA